MTLGNPVGVDNLHHVHNLFVKSFCGLQLDLETAIMLIQRQSLLRHNNH